MAAMTTKSATDGPASAAAALSTTHAPSARSDDLPRQNVSRETSATIMHNPYDGAAVGLGGRPGDGRGGRGRGERANSLAEPPGAAPRGDNAAGGGSATATAAAAPGDATSNKSNSSNNKNPNNCSASPPSNSNAAAAAETISYSAERIIGNGSFGVVFQASVVETGEVVAIKKVLQDKRFKNRELQIMRQLVKDGHSNIVALKHCFYSQVSVLGIGSWEICWD